MIDQLNMQVAIRLKQQWKLQPYFDRILLFMKGIEYFVVF